MSIQPTNNNTAPIRQLYESSPPVLQTQPQVATVDRMRAFAELHLNSFGESYAQFKFEGKSLLAYQKAGGRPKVFILEEKVEVGKGGFGIAFKVPKVDLTTGKVSSKVFKMPREEPGRFEAAIEGMQTTREVCLDIHGSGKDAVWFLKPPRLVTITDPTGKKCQAMLMTSFEGDLFTLSENNPGMLIEDRLFIGYQLFGELSLLHGKGRIHHDIKPENILGRATKDSPEVFLADLDGCSKTYDLKAKFNALCNSFASKDRIMEELLGIHTPKYLPDTDVDALILTVRDGDWDMAKQIIQAIDVYALGQSFLYALTGDMAFPRAAIGGRPVLPVNYPEDQAELILDLLKPEQLQLAPLLNQLLHPDPFQRPNAKEACNAFADIIRNEWPAIAFELDRVKFA